MRAISIYDFSKSRSGSVPRGALLAACVLLPPWAAGQEAGFYAVPSVSVAAVHDDNIFFDNRGEEIDDLITRVSPGLEVGYETATLHVLGNYSFDAEWYQDHGELDSSQVRRFADTSVEYLASANLELSLGFNYGKTQTPGELNLVSGLQPARREAERWTINPGLNYTFNANTLMTLEYIGSTDEFEDGVESDQHELATVVEHALNANNTLLLGYSYRKYDFSGIDPDTGLPTLGNDTDTHTPYAGIEHAFNPRTRFRIAAGPRINGDEQDPYVQATFSYDIVRGQLSLNYEIDETTLIGESGRLENETLSASLNYQFTPSFEINVTPSYTELDRPNSAAEVWRLGMDARYRFNDALSLIARYQRNDQSEDFLLLPDGELERNVFTIGFNLSYPRTPRGAGQ